jgi:DnaJ-class molecular chaperone with C-terminal Zn finger domain
MVEQDYYDLLGIARGADDAAIKSAYRKLAKECHPDRHNGCSEQTERFKQISEAYDVLKDPQKRAAYDRFGKAAFQNGAVAIRSVRPASTDSPTSSRQSLASSWIRGAHARTRRAVRTCATISS